MGISKEETECLVVHKMKIAKDFESAGKHLHAVQIYKNLIETYPTYSKAYFNLADLYEHLGNPEPAVDMLKNFLNKDPGNIEVRLFLGQYLMRNEKWEEANNVLNLPAAKDDPVVSFFLGYINYRMEEFETAKMNFLNFVAVEMKPDLLQEAFLYLAKIEIELSDFENALAFAKKAEILYGNFWELNLIIAISYFHLGMYAHAIIPVEKAKKQNPKEASSNRWAGKIYLRSGNFLKAEKNFLKYIELTESASSELYTDLAEACLKGGKPKDALTYYGIALKLNPENQSAITGRESAASAIENYKANNG